MGELEVGVVMLGRGLGGGPKTYRGDRALIKRKRGIHSGTFGHSIVTSVRAGPARVQAGAGMWLTSQVVSVCAPPWALRSGLASWPTRGPRSGS